MFHADIFDDVPVFASVVDCGSFAAAARRLNVSRSAVGKAIARLEHRLDARLFHRTTRSQSLTEDGQAFHDHCRVAIEALQNGKALLDHGRTQVSGTLRMTVPVVFGRICAMPLLSRLVDDNPLLALEVDFRDHHVDLIDAGLDLAIRNGPIGPGNGLMARRIGRKRSIVCASPAYLAHSGSPAEPEDLYHHRAIVYCRDDRALKWVFPQAGSVDEEILPPSQIRLNDLGSMLDAALEGRGIAWLPDWLVGGSIKDGRLVALLGHRPGRVEDITALWPETSHLPTRVRYAIDALVAGFASEWA